MTWSANKDRTLALAALLQAGELVVQLSQKDSYDKAALRASADSVMMLEEENAEVIFGGATGLYLGLNTMRTLLRATPTPAHRELIRYTVSMAQLSQRLMQSNTMQSLISKGVYDLQNQFRDESDEELDEESDDGASDESIAEDEITDVATDELGDESDEQSAFNEDAFYIGIGKLYQNSLSQLEPKIIVRGAQGQLESMETVSKVRTALFAGVRAAYLWHQLGGRRWHLMLARKSYVVEASELQQV